MLRPALHVLVIALMLAPSVDAQGTGTGKLPRTAQYRVRGFYEGDEMEPWDAQLTLADTALEGKGSVLARYETRKAASGFLFTLTAAWPRDGGAATHIRWSNRGRVPSECTLTQSGNKLTGTLDASAISATLPDGRVAVPDFAVGAFLSQRSLADGDTISLAIVRCGTNLVPSIEVRDARMVVRGDSAQRGTGQPEAAWLVEDNGIISLKAWIAKSDHQLLRTQTPQGRVGYSIDQYLGSPR